MQAGSQTNALAEIALALSMGFFSIMVLTLVSMSAGKREFVSSLPDTIDVKSSQNSQTQIRRTVKSGRQNILVFYEGQFFDGRLKETSPELLRTANNGRNEKLILAVEPNLSMEEAVRVRRQFAGRDLTVTTLTPDWLKRLKETEK